jgi:hypothetical protein
MPPAADHFARRTTPPINPAPRTVRTPREATGFRDVGVVRAGRCIFLRWGRSGWGMRERDGHGTWGALVGGREVGNGVGQAHG